MRDVDWNSKLKQGHCDLFFIGVMGMWILCFVLELRLEINGKSLFAIHLFCCCFALFSFVLFSVRLRAEFTIIVNGHIFTYLIL